MKSYGFFLFYCMASLYAMEQSHEIWDASLAAKNDKVYEVQVISDLNDSKIDFTNKFVLDLCSGTGNHSNLMAQRVGKEGFVLGIDASKSMTDWAKNKYFNQVNLSFHCCNIKQFELSQSKSQFHVVTLFNSFDLLDDKLAVCKKIYKNLKPGGDLLINVGPGREPLDIQVSREMIKSVWLMGNLLAQYGLEGVFKSSYCTEQEYKEILQKAGFEIISLIKKQRCLTFDSKEDFAAIKRPIAQSRPVVQSIPTWIFNYAFNQFIEQFLTKLQKNEKEQLVYRFDEILIHARRPYLMSNITFPMSIKFLEEFAGGPYK